MNYESFKTAIIKYLMAEIPEPKSITINKVQKNNGRSLDGLTILEGHSNISPTIYLDYYYEEYEKGVSFLKLCQDILDVYRENATDNQVNVEFFTDFSRVKHMITFRLINYDKNIALLQDIPHKRFLDLAIVFYCSVPIDEALGEGSILIHNSHLQYWNVDTDELYALARENTPLLFPVQLDSMVDLLCHMDLPIDEMMEWIESGPRYPMYVLTNTRGHHGAACILYKDMIHSFSEQMESDLYIIPSSIHEVLLVPTSHGISSNDINEMIHDVNQNEVPLEDILSDHVYLYKRNERSITIPNTLL